MGYVSVVEYTAQALDTAAVTMFKCVNIFSVIVVYGIRNCSYANTIMNFSVGPDTSENDVKVLLLKFAANYLNKNATILLHSTEFRYRENFNELFIDILKEWCVN